jgi:hypothetical protein
MKSIRFAKKKALLITSQNLVNVIKKNIINNTNIDIFTKSYKLVNSKNINDLNRFNYKCTLRSYGKLYILYLIKINNQNYCLFINLKKKDIISVRVKFKDSLYNGTLIYGELLKDNDKNWIFVTNDIYLYQGKLLNNFNLDKRIEILKNIFVTEYNKDDNIDPCTFKVKQYFEYKYLLSLKDDYSKDLNYRISGYMFNRTDLINDNYVYIYPENRNNNDNKENEIFFKISDTKLPDVYELYCYDNNNLVKYGYASIPNIKTSKLIQKIFDDNAENGDIIVSCKYSDQFNKWIPIRKCSTNSISSLKTINKILKI